MGSPCHKIAIERWKDADHSVDQAVKTTFSLDPCPEKSTSSTLRMRGLPNSQALRIPQDPMWALSSELHIGISEQ